MTAWWTNPQAWYAIGMWMMAAGIWLHVWQRKRDR